MAPTLTSNSFLPTSTPHSRITPKNHRSIVFAKRVGKTGNDDEVKDKTPFRFDFGKLPDVNSLVQTRFDFGKLPDVNSLVKVVTKPSTTGLSFGSQRRKDSGTVFVAGATGQAGVRIAQTLLRRGFSVRAGVPDLGAAQELARLAAEYKFISNDEARRLNAVASTFDNAESIAKAIGNASKVVVTIGNEENGPSAVVTTSDALQVIEAAQLAKVGHVAIVYNESSEIASTYNVLDGITSFFNNLFAKSQPLTIAEFLQNVVKTDVSYTLIKTKLTEDFLPESSYNLVVSAEGSAGANDYKVAKSQIASLVADVFSNTAVAENKVVEVFSDPSAPSKAIDELFGAIPEDGRRKAYAEALAKEKAEEEAIKASEQAREAAEAARKGEKELKKLEKEEARAASVAAEAQNKAEAAGASVESFLSKAKGLSSGISWENLSSQLKSAVQKPDDDDEEPKVQVATVRGQAKARSLPSLKAVVRNPARQPPSKSKDIPKPKGKVAEPKKETRKVFGGLFQQETIYVDDD